MRRFLVLVTAALALAACGERAALEEEVRRLRSQRDKLAHVAENLDEYAAEIDELAKDSAAAEAMGVSLSHDDRIKKVARMPGVAAKRVFPHGAGAASSPWEITGSGPELFAALRTSSGALAIEKATFTPPAWVVSVPAWDPIGPFSSYVPGTTPHPTPRTTPKRGRFETKRTMALRAEIEALEREMEELDRLIGHEQPLTAFEQRKRDFEANRNLLHAPSRLARAGLLAMPLFLDAKPACAQGSLVIAQQSVRFWCKPAAGGDDLEAASGRLRETLSAIRGWKVGTISIDEGAPEPLQGTLTPATP